ncbi:MAG: 2-oxo acid dehydrogenase subunit E2 [Planctomycetota bacterium]
MHNLRMPSDAGAQPHATVIRWFVEPGQDVQADQDLVELQSSSALLRVASPAAGRLIEIQAGTGVTVKPGDPLGRIDETGQAAAIAPNQTNPTPQQGPQTMTSASCLPEGVKEILLPQVGNTMEEGTILKWHVAEGDTIQTGQVLYEVETDKATVEIEAEQEGTLARIVVGEGQTVAVKTPIAYLGEDVSAVDGYLSAAGETGQGSTETPDSSAAPAPKAEGPKGEVTPLLMPQVGNTMEEGTILGWKVSEGDTIEPGMVLYEVETDKATVEIEAENTGRLARIVVDEGETIAVKQPVAYLAENDEDVDAYIASQGSPAEAPRKQQAEPAAAAKSAPKSAAPAAGKTEAGRIKASPAARKLAEQKGVDLASIASGSGPGGRILTEDVEAAPVSPAAAASAPAAPAGPKPISGGGRQKLSKMRKAIGNALQASKQTIPHFYMTTEIRADAMLAFYAQQKSQYKLSVNDLIVQACAIGLGEFPSFRSRIEGDEMVTLDSANIGIAVGMEEGLVVPVVMGADRFRLRALAAETRRVVQAARAGKLENIGQGCFTISNLGMFAVDEFSAIINPPEAAILAVAAAKEAVIVENGAMRPGKVMKVTLSCDHRIVDGLAAAQFSARLKEILEAPAENLG